MTIRPTRLVAMLAVCTVMGGCATSAGADAQAQPSWPTANYDGPIRARAVYENAGIILDVPSSEQRASVAWSDAYVSNCTTGDAICDPSGPPTIVLAKATTTSAGEEQKDGSIAPIMKDTLVYVVQWTGVPCMPVGPMRPTNETAATAAKHSCTVMNFIDATTGLVLYSVQGPNL